MFVNSTYCGDPDTALGYPNHTGPKRKIVPSCSAKTSWSVLYRVSGNARTPSMACWKARGRLYIRHNWTFFATSYGWDVVSGNLSKSPFFEGVGHFRRIFDREGGFVHQPLLVSENWSDCRFVWYQKIRSPSFGFVAYTRVTDGQTDRHTYRIATAITCVALHAVAR